MLYSPYNLSYCWSSCFTGMTQTSPFTVIPTAVSHLHFLGGCHLSAQGYLLGHISMQRCMHHIPEMGHFMVRSFSSAGLPLYHSGYITTITYQTSNDVETLYKEKPTFDKNDAVVSNAIIKNTCWKNSVDYGGSKQQHVNTQQQIFQCVKIKVNVPSTFIKST